MRRATPDLRPLTTPEALDAAALMLWRSAPRYYALSLPATLPVVLLTLGYLHWAGTLVKGTGAEAYWRGTQLWALAMAAAWTFLSISRGALSAAMLAGARGETLGAGACWRLALRRAPTLALIGTLATAGCWLASLAGVIGGLIILAAWMVARSVAVDEEQPYLEALRRSAALTSGYRGKCGRLWALFLLVWGVALLNVYFGVQGVLGLLNMLLGVDLSRWVEFCSYRNEAYVVWLCLALFLLLDPLKSCADTALYLDLRIRREGADLQARLRALGAALGVAALLLLSRPAAAMTLEQYRRDVQALQRQVDAARSPAQVDERLRRSVTYGTVRLPDGGTIPVNNGWLAAASDWRNAEERQHLVNRLEALSRALAPANAPPNTARAPARANPEQAYQEAMARPEFQQLEDRPELRNLARSIRAPHAGSWFERLYEWIKQHLQKPPQTPAAPDTSGFRWNERIGRIILYALLALAGAILLALVTRALYLRWQERGEPKPAPAAAAPLEESLTENALDHSVDQWEQFAAEWLRRGDLRQAIRALYLALLVDLHHQRLIDYNRAFTNWQYVRQFAGAAEQRQVLRRLTEVFDLAWYGRRNCSTEQYEAFAGDVRSLAAGEPTGGLAHA